MSYPSGSGEENKIESLKCSLMVLMFGVTVLIFLVVMGREDWFHIRPASGTAVAMANAATSNVDHQRR